MTVNFVKYFHNSVFTAKNYKLALQRLTSKKRNFSPQKKPPGK